VLVGETELNSTGRLGNTKLAINIEDTASNPTTAVTLINHAVNSNAVAVGYGLLATTAAITAPIANRAGVPYIEVSADQPGILNTGSAIFHATGPPVDWTGPQMDYWAQKGVKRVAMLWDNDNDAYTNIVDADKRLLAAKGISVVSEQPIKTTDTDLSAQVTSIGNAKPDAVLVGALGTQTGTAVTQLRRAGYTGLIGITDGSAVYTLPALGKLADGISWPTAFSPAAKAPSAAHFTALFEKAYPGKVPELFDALGYDAVQFLAAAIQASPDPTTRSGLTAGLEKVVDGLGYTGVEGHISYGPGPGGAHDASAPGIAVVWGTGGTQTVVATK
jgi:branched-chain amino acid transport system substrate-binding protein